MLTTELMKSLKQINVSADPEKTKVRLGEDFKASTASQKKEMSSLTGQVINSFYRSIGTGKPNARLVLAAAQILNVSPFYYTGETDEKINCSNDLIKEFLIKHKYPELAESISKKQKRTYNKAPKVNNVNPVESADNAKDNDIAVGNNNNTAADANDDVIDKDINNTVDTDTVEVDDIEVDDIEVDDIEVDDIEIEDIDTDDIEIEDIEIDDDEPIMHLSFGNEIKEAADSLTEDEVITLIKSLLIRARVNDEATNLIDMIKMLMLS